MGFFVFFFNVNLFLGTSWPDSLAYFVSYMTVRESQKTRWMSNYPQVSPLAYLHTYTWRGIAGEREHHTNTHNYSVCVLSTLLGDGLNTSQILKFPLDKTLYIK